MDVMHAGGESERLIGILDRLVAFRSVCGGPNGEMIDWIAEFLTGAGCRVTVVPGERDGASSLFASIGPEATGGIILSAHSDVVPVEGQAWQTDPFVLTREDDRLYGRGTSDMKGFLACMLHVAEEAGRQELCRPLHFAVSYDEELGCLGVRSLLRAVGQADLEASGAIIGEPTEMQAALAHKGKIAFRVVCRGIAAHSANPSKGVNAISVAAGMVTELDRLLAYIKENERHDARFEVPFSTVQVGLIEGGTALNIVPEECVLTSEIRLLPAVDGAGYLEWLEDAASRLMDVFPGARVMIEVVNAYPGLNGDPESEIAAFVMNRMRQNEPGVVGFGTEAGLFSEMLDMPSVICGPGSISRAHKADEFITVGELEDGARFLFGVLESLVI